MKYTISALPPSGDVSSFTKCFVWLFIIDVALYQPVYSSSLALMRLVWSDKTFEPIK